MSAKPSITELMEDLFRREGIASLDNKRAKLQVLVEDGYMTPNEAASIIEQYKRNKGMANGGDVRSGIGSFISRMNKGGEAFNNILSGIDTIFKGLIQVESRGNPNAVSPTGAIGLSQVLTSTAMEPGNNVENIFEIAKRNGVPFAEKSKEEAKRLLFNANLNVQFGKQYLGAMIERFGNVKDALLAYNAGPTTVDRFIDGGRDVTLLTDEAKGYVPKVMQALGAGDFGFENVPTVPVEEQKPFSEVLPKTFSAQGLDFLKSEDPINPVYTVIPQSRPTDLVAELGLPGDVMRESQMPMARPEELAMSEEEPITLASSAPPLRRPFEIN